MLEITESGRGQPLRAESSWVKRGQAESATGRPNINGKKITAFLIPKWKSYADICLNLFGGKFNSLQIIATFHSE